MTINTVINGACTDSTYQTTNGFLSCHRMMLTNLQNEYFVLFSTNLLSPLSPIHKYPTALRIEIVNSK